MSGEAEPRRRDLPRLVVRGVGWMMASQGATQVLALLTSVTLARFLSPRELGLAAEAIVFVTLALVLVDFGFAAVIVQRPNLSEVDASTAFWAGMAFGIVMTLAGVGLSWPVASLYGEPRVQRLFAVLSLTFLFTAPGIVQGALLTRELKFRSLELRTIAATAISCTTAITLAALGFGAWAIVAQTLTIAGVSTVLLWRSSTWRPRAVFSLASLREMAGFTGHVFGAKTLSWARMNVDNLLVGRFLGAAALGAYSIAYSMAVTPLNRIAVPLSQVFFPAFSRMRDPAEIAQFWLRASRLLALIVVPLMLGLVVVAPDFVRVVFGPKWHAAGPVLQLLAPVGMLQALSAPSAAVLQALDRARVLFRFTVVSTAACISAFAAGLPWGIEGVATAYLLISVVVQPAFVRVTAGTVGLSLWDWLRSVSGVFQAGTAMLLIVAAARRLLERTELAAGPRLVALILLGAAVYGVLVVWRAPEIKRELRSALEGRRLLHRHPSGETTEAPA